MELKDAEKQTENRGANWGGEKNLFDLTRKDVSYFFF